MNVKIFVATHKKVDFKLDDGYELVQVGSSLKDDLGYLKDNVGENISEKNKNYCELTMLYWMWKNCNCDVTGLVHYRRFFYKGFHVININEIKKIISKSDIILPRKKVLHLSNVYNDYDKNHYIKDLNLCGEIIKEICPDYYDSFNILMKKKCFYTYNMFICKKNVSDLYCRWLFPILFELEKRINIDEYDDYNKRIFGFLSERLFNVWIINNKFKIYECSVYNREKNILIEKIKEIIHYIFRWL